MSAAAAELPFAELSGPKFSLFRFTPPGPVAAGYLGSGDPLAFIMGPAGSGKTTTSIFKCAAATMRMPVCKDGVIRARGFVCRDNYRTLYKTTLESWFQFFPKDFPGSSFEGGQDRPAKHTIRFMTPAGKRVEMMVDFAAVGDHAIEEVMKGYEPSWAWCNEVDLLHERVPGFIYTRTGRYPSRALLADEKADLPRQVFNDFNPTDIDHWLYQKLVEKPVNGWRLFKQPSGLSDRAENRAGVAREYYQGMIDAGIDELEIVRFVHGEWGYSRDGRPVYGETFVLDRHRSPVPLKILSGVPVHAGLDQGFSPAIVFFQIDPETLQIRVLREIVPDHGTGAERFAPMILRVLDEDFRACALGVFSADPAGFYGADRVAGQLAWAESVAAAIGHPIVPAPTNEPGLRISAVRLPLSRQVGNVPGMIIDPSCRKVIGGFVSHYKFRKIKLGNREVFEDRPEKNAYANPHDALQYGVLGVQGRAGIINAIARDARPGQAPGSKRSRVGKSEFQVWNY